MNIIKIKEVTSTNIYAVEKLKEQIPEWTVYLADYQLNGKGQKGNLWESEQGKNLTFSIVLEPSFLAANKQYIISKIACLGIKKTLSDYIENVKIKWPNDVYVGNKKICGILIENQIKGTTLSNSIIGIGININQEHFFSDAPNPISLKQLTNTSYNLDDLLLKTLENIRKYYSLLQKEDDNIINKEFFENMYRIGEWHKFINNTGVFNGRIDGVSEIGQLQITNKDNNIQKEYHFKEVAFVI